MNVLERINFECKVSNDVKDLFSKDHAKYDCDIEYNGKEFSFTYQCNPKYSQPTKESCIGSLTLDAESFEYSRDFEDFRNDFGYTKISEYKKHKKFIMLVEKFQIFYQWLLQMKKEKNLTKY